MKNNNLLIVLLSNFSHVCENYKINFNNFDEKYVTQVTEVTCKLH